MAFASATLKCERVRKDVEMKMYNSHAHAAAIHSVARVQSVNSRTCIERPPKDINGVKHFTDNANIYTDIVGKMSSGAHTLAIAIKRRSHDLTQSCARARARAMLFNTLRGKSGYTMYSSAKDLFSTASLKTRRLVVDVAPRRYTVH